MTSEKARPFLRRGDGQFGKGTGGGPGRPAVDALRRREFFALVREAITEGDLRALVERVKKKASRGSLTAARLIFDLSREADAAAPRPRLALEQIRERLAGRTI